MNASSFFRRGLVAVVAIFLVVCSALGQGILKNGGVFRNTGSATYKSIQNYNTGAGTIQNQGTLTTSTGGLVNTNGSTLNGTVKNYIGGGGNGTIVVATDITNSHAGATIDNDSTAGFSTIKVAGAINNTGGTLTTTRGRVNYNGSGAQTVLATTYGTLVTDVGGTKTLAALTTVNDSLRIDNASTLSTSTFEIDLAGATNVAQNTGALTASSGIVQYTGDRDQTVIPAQYKTLTFTAGASTERIKTSPGGISFATGGALTVGAHDTLYVSSGNLDLSANTPTLANNDAIKVAGNATFHGGITNAGSFYYDGASSQNIGAVTYANLVLGNVGTKTFPNGGTVAVTGNYTINSDAGARTYTNNTFQFAGTTGTQSVTNLAETFNIIQFSGAALKTLAGTAFGAAQMDLLSGTAQVTNNVTTVTLTNIGNVSLTIASGTELVNTGTINMNGDLQNDGFLTNSGTIGVY